MTGRTFAERLAAAGLDGLEVPAKARLFDSVLLAFGPMSSGQPECVCWVPGRLEVFGTHTDYAGGRALVSAVPRGFAFAGRRRVDGQLHVLDAAGGQSMAIDSNGRGPSQTGWRRYVEVVVQRLARNFPGAALGADLVFASDLPRAAGMSSSSALIVGAAVALVRLAGLRERSEWQDHIDGPLAEAGYYACVENGRTFEGLAGDEGVGTHGGSEDHAAMICGEAGGLSAFAFVPMRRVDSVLLPEPWRIVIASSGVAAEKTGAALGSYNRLAHGTTTLLDIWNRSERFSPSLAAVVDASPGGTARLRTLLGAAHVEGWSAAALDARLQHFIREDARVPAAVGAFGRADAPAIRSIAESSQVDSEHLLGNQVGETMTLVRLGLAQGAFATRSFGAGFGGSVWALVEREEASAFALRWLDAYLDRYPAARDPVAFIAQPGPPVVELVP